MINNSPTKRPDPFDAPARTTPASLPPLPMPDAAWDLVEPVADMLDERSVDEPDFDVCEACQVANRVVDEVRRDRPLFARFRAIGAAGELDRGILGKVTLYACAAAYTQGRVHDAALRRRRGYYPLPDDPLWQERRDRAWTLLVDAYEELRCTGRWLLRSTPGAAQRRFPALVKKTRAPR